MLYLFAVSLLWAVSFGLIKDQLAGTDATAVAAVRLAISLLVFLPWLRPRATRPHVALQYTATGAVQFGLMYVLYIAAYADLAAHEIALFTVLTPLWVAVVDDALSRRFSGWTLAAAALAVVGAAVVKWTDVASPGLVRGFLLVQASNLCFAVGQVAYRRVRARHPGPPDHAVFAWLYLGGFATAGVLSLTLAPPGALAFSARQWGVLAYLGAIATDGSVKVNRGADRLVVFPYPRNRRFTVELDAKALGLTQAPTKVQALQALSDEVLADVPCELRNGRIRFAVGAEGAGRYLVLP